MAFYPEEGHIWTPNYVADTKLEYLIHMSKYYNVQIEYLPTYLGLEQYWKSILLLVVTHGDLFEMERIILTYGFDVNIPIKDNLTPIWFACEHGHFGLVQKLIIMGANVNIYNHHIKMSCLDIAYRHKFSKTCALLVAYNAKSYYGDVVYNIKLPKAPVKT